MDSLHEKYQLRDIIRSYEIDAFGKLSLTSLLYYFQEAANHHATALNWGMEYLSSINKFWVLSRLKVVIEKYPQHKNEIVISTWPRGADGFFAYRDYQITLNNLPVINAVSSWLILDQASHRPTKVDQIGKPLPKYEESHLPFPENKLPNLIKPELIFEKKVNFSDIDINQHLNNAKYLEIIVDALFDSLSRSFEIREIDIQYLHESQQGDILKVYSEKTSGNSMMLCIQNSTKGKESCRCEVKGNPPAY